MFLTVLVLLIFLTVFQPYLEMQMNLYLLKFKHWKYQIHTNFILARVHKHLQMASFYSQRYKSEEASAEADKAEALLKKNWAMYEEISKLADQFRDTYI